MAYQHHPHNHYAAADGGTLAYLPHEIYANLHTTSFPAPYAAAAQPDLFQPHYIYYEEESFFYNYLPEFAAAHGQVHHPAFTQETTAFHGGISEVAFVYGPFFSVDGDEDDENPPMALPRRSEDGLPEEVVARFLEKMACEEADDDGGELELCAVCQDDLGRKIVALNCRHRFHGECVGKWLQMKNSCPLCKAIAIDH